MYHNKVEQLFEFLKSHPSNLRGLILVKLLSMVFICQELMFMKCLITYFTIGENLLTSLHPKVWTSQFLYCFKTDLILRMLRIEG